MLTPYRARAAATSPDSAGAGYPGASAGSHSRPGTSRTTRPAAACAGPGTPDRPCLPARPGARASSAGAPKRSAPQLRTLAARCAGWPRKTGRPGPAPRPREAAATGPDAGPGPRDPGTAMHLAPNATADQLPELRLPLRGSGILPAGDLCWPRYREARAWLRLSRITPRGRTGCSPRRAPMHKHTVGQSHAGAHRGGKLRHARLIIARGAAVRRSSSGLHGALAECSRSDIMGGCCATYCCATPFGTSVLSPRQDVVR